MKSLTAQDFQKEVIEASYQIPVLVDFWAEWCGPCRMLSPLLEKLEQDYQGKWKLVKVNTDHEPQLAMQFQVSGIPHCVLFMNGKPVDSFTGALPEPHIRNFLDKHLPNEEKEEILNLLQSTSHNDLQKGIELALEKKLLNPEISRYLWNSLSILAQEENLELITKILELLLQEQNEYSSSATFLIDYIKKYKTSGHFWEYFSKLISLNLSSDPGKILDFFYQLIENHPEEKQELKDHLIACFHILGQNHPLSNEYRKKLSRLLY